jgi:hypothetical protein
MPRTIWNSPEVRERAVRMYTERRCAHRSECVVTLTVNLSKPSAELGNPRCKLAARRPTVPSPER